MSAKLAAADEEERGEEEEVMERQRQDTMEQQDMMEQQEFTRLPFPKVIKLTNVKLHFQTRDSTKAWIVPYPSARTRSVTKRYSAIPCEFLMKDQNVLEKSFFGATDACVSNYLDTLNLVILKKARDEDLLPSGLKTQPNEQILPILDTRYRDHGGRLLHLEVEQDLLMAYMDWSDEARPMNFFFAFL